MVLAAAMMMAGDGWIGRLEAQSLVASRLKDGYMKDHANYYAGLNLEESGKSVVLDVADSRLNLGAFNDGMASKEDDTATFEDAFELWKSFAYGRIGGSVNEDYWDSLMVWTRQYLQQGIVPLLWVDADYYRLSKAFWASKGYDINEDSSGIVKVGNWQESDFERGYAFAAVPMVKAWRGEYDRIILDPRFMIVGEGMAAVSGYGYEVDGVSYDLQVGVAAPLVLKKRMSQLRFVLRGVQDSVRLKFFTNPLIGKGGMKDLAHWVRVWVNLLWNSNWNDVLAGRDIEVFEVRSRFKDMEFGDEISGMAKISVDLGTGENGLKHRCMQRPLVFVEGIDFGYEDLPTGCRDGKCGSIGYIDLLKGKQWNSELGVWEEWASVEHAGKMLQRYKDSGYDIVYVDFEKGADWIDHNAQVLREVMKWVKLRMCGDRFHVVGASMGGLVAKYALNMMEEAGETGCVVSFTTFDTPHEGANIPLSAQHTMEYFRGVNRACKDAVNRKLNARAAKQMLLYHYGSTDTCAKERIAFMSRGYAKGFPASPWKMAVSNGSGLGLDGVQELIDGSEMVRGSLLYRIRYTKGMVTLLEASAVAATGCILAAKGVKILMEGFEVEGYAMIRKEVVKNRLHNMVARVHIGLKNHFYEVARGSSCYDHQPGGRTDVVKYFGFKGLVIAGDLGATGTCFIPTWSALGLDGKEWTKSSLQRLGAGWLQLKSGEFDDYYVADKNQDHVYFDSAADGNAMWLLHRLLWLDRAPSLSDVSTEVVFGGLRDRFVRDLHVYDGGKLMINTREGAGNLEILTDEEKMLAKLKVRKFFQKGCYGSEIHVWQGGEFVVGSGFNGKQATEFHMVSAGVMEVHRDGKLMIMGGKATMKVVKGAVLKLESGSMLIVDNGCSLIIEEGGRLVVGKDVRILLNGSASLLHVNGCLEMADETILSPSSYGNIPVGLLKLSAVGKGFGTAEIVGSKIGIVIRGNGINGSAVLQWEGNFDLHKQLVKFEMEEAAIKFGLGTRVILGGNVKLKNSSFTALEWSVRGGNVLYVKGGNTWVDGCVFSELDTGLVVMDGGKFESLTESEFEHCGVGLVVRELGFSGFFNRFFECDKGAMIFAEKQLQAMDRCTFIGNNTVGLDVLGGPSSMSCGYYTLVRESMFLRNKLAMNTLNRDIALACAEFSYNDNGLEQYGGMLAMGAGSGLKYGKDTLRLGNNSFNKNEYSQIHVTSVQLYPNGRNNFIMDGNMSFLKPSVWGSINNDEGDAVWNVYGSNLNFGNNYVAPIRSAMGMQDVMKYHVALEFETGTGESLLLKGNMLPGTNITCFSPKAEYKPGKKGEGVKRGLQDELDVDAELEEVISRWPNEFVLYDLTGKKLSEVEVKQDANWQLRFAEGVYLMRWMENGETRYRKIYLGK